MDDRRPIDAADSMLADGRLRLVVDLPGLPAGLVDQRAERLAGAFTHAWRKVPTSARQVIEQHWDRPGPEQPTVILAYDWARRQGAAASCASEARCLCFHESLARLAPDDALQSVVGHELAHALLFGLQREACAADRARGELWTVALPVVGSRAEDAAVEIAETWGLPLTSFVEWVRRHPWVTINWRGAEEVSDTCARRQRGDVGDANELLSTVRGAAAQGDWRAAAFLLRRTEL